MKKTCFYDKKKDLHIEMLQSIGELFELGGIQEIEFEEDNESGIQPPFVILSPDGAGSTYETRIEKARYEDGIVSIKVGFCETWISCEHGGLVVTGTLDELYDALFDYVCVAYRKYYLLKFSHEGHPVDIDEWKYTLREAKLLRKNRSAIYADGERGFVFDTIEEATKELDRLNGIILTQ